MLVGDQDGVDGGEVLADGGQPPGEFPHAQPGVHQNARVFGGQQGGVAGTAAGQHAELDDGRLLEIPGTKILKLQNTIMMRAWQPRR